VVISYLLFLYVDLWNINKISISINLHRFCYLEVMYILSSFPNKVWVKLADVT